MNIYYFVYSLFIVILYPTLLNKNLINNLFLKAFFYFLTFILIFLATFRLNTGTDYHSYLSFWNNVESLTSGKEFAYYHFEPGIRFIASFLKDISNNFSIFLFFISATSLLIYIYVLNQYKLNYILALFLYFLVFYLAYVYNMMQQAVIMSCFLLIFYKIEFKLKNFFKILSITLVLSLIHKSALLILIFYFTYIIIDRIKSVFLVTLTFILPIILIKSGIVNLLLSPFDIYINQYLSNESFARQTSLFEISTRIILFSIMSYFAMSLKNNLQFQNLFKIYLIGIFFYFLLSDYNMLATRISMFSRIVEPLLYSIILLQSKNLFTRNIVLCIVLILYSYQFFIVINNPDFYYQFSLS